MKRIIITLLICVFFSCSTDDNNEEPKCLETEVTMVVNGELQNFQAIGYGISMRENGYLLQLNLDRRDNDPFRQQTVVIQLEYLKTGKNIIDKFDYHQYIDDQLFEGDFVNYEFENTVITNSNKCFSATFSGKIIKEDQEVIITDGILNMTYRNPFDVINSNSWKE